MLARPHLASDIKALGFRCSAAYGVLLLEQAKEFPSNLTARLIWPGTSALLLAFRCATQTAAAMTLAARGCTSSLCLCAQGAARAPASGASRRSAPSLYKKMRWSMLLLVLYGQALCASAAAPAPAPAAAEGAPTSADVLLPETDSDIVALLSHFMRAQHEVVLATHGPVRCCACATCSI